MRYAMIILLIAALFIAGCGEKEIIEPTKNITPVTEPEPIVVDKCPINVDLEGKTTICKDDSCDYTSLEEAIEFGATDIVITDCETYNDHVSIKGSDITIDCQNAVLDGKGQQTGFDIQSGSENIVIQNCKISDYIYGVSMLNTKNSKVLNNEFSKNSAAIRLKLGTSDQVKDNTLSENNQGMLIESSSDATISGNTVTGSTLNGIQISGASDGCIIDNNIVTGSGMSGIKNLARGNTISNNEAKNNQMFGIECQLSQDVELSDNVCTGNEAGECSECETTTCTRTSC